MRDEDGTPANFLTYIKDITHRKSVEETLVQNEERYRLVVNALSEGVALYNRDMQ